MNKNEEKINVYDWPVRFFHWTFVLMFGTAFFIAKTFEDDSTTYPYHMMIGLILGAAVLLRIIWGIFGSKYARFTSFELRPRDLVSYLKGIIQGSGKKSLGHNPASSWAALIMMACALGLAGTGYLMSHGQKEDFEDFHELFANGLLFTAIAHVAGVILHTIRHKDPIGLSMIIGKKTSSEKDQGIKNNFLLIGLLFVVLVSSFGVHVFKNYDENSKSLKLLGSTYQLGKVEEED